MRSARACRNLGDIRAAVNAIDRQIVKLLGKRTQYARAAFAFKTDRKSIGRAAHYKKVIAKRQAWALQHGADPRMVARIYLAVVHASKRMHLAAFRARRKAAK